MSRGSTLRHAQTAGDLGFAVQFNAETPWHYVSSAILGSDSRRLFEATTAYTSKQRKICLLLQCITNSHNS